MNSKKEAAFAPPHGFSHRHLPAAGLKTTPQKMVKNCRSSIVKPTTNLQITALRRLADITPCLNYSKCKCSS